MKISVLGGGNMGGAIASGIILSRTAKDTEVSVSHARASFTSLMQEKNLHPHLTTDNVLSAQDADVIFVAVKPWMAEDVLKEIIPHINPARTVVASVVAGLSFDTMAGYFTSLGATPAPMYRIIPNTAISLGQSATFISSWHTTEEQDRFMDGIFSSLGEVFHVPESDMTAVTALASCGIAYILRYMDAAMRGGEEMGIDRGKSLRIVMQTVRGALALLEQNGTLPQQEIDKVTTPGGITLKGLEEMERNGFSTAVIKGLKASR